MLDFKELSTDGTQFELLMREVLFLQGMDVHWSGIGPDGGRDLLCDEILPSRIKQTSRRWLIQCKHFAHSERAVGKNDLDDVVDSCAEHGATGYILACSTYASSAVVRRLEEIEANPKNDIVTHTFDAAIIERLLSTPQTIHVAQRFFPVSTGGKKWVISHTDRPNHVIVNFRGFIFHLVNRIGSKFDMHLITLENRLDDLERVKLPEGQFLRPRALWYDDKNGGYLFYVDYMMPHDQQPAFSASSLSKSLGSGDVLEDGQYYRIDVVPIKYMPLSDHYDRDHYQYYTPYIGSFLTGEGRSRSLLPDYPEFFRSDKIRPVPMQDCWKGIGVERSFKALDEELGRCLGSDYIGGENALPELLDYLRQGTLSEFMDEYGCVSENLSVATFKFKPGARKAVLQLIEGLPVTFDCLVSCSEGLTFIPDDAGKYTPSIDAPGKRLVFLRLSSPFETDTTKMRDNFSTMFNTIREKLSRQFPR